jgi:hypothetical protein
MCSHLADVFRLISQMKAPGWDYRPNRLIHEFQHYVWTGPYGNIPSCRLSEVFFRNCGMPF